MEKQSKPKEVTEVTIAIADTASLGQLREMETGFSLNPSYRDKEEWIELKGKPVRAFYCGLRELPNKEGEAVTCGVFVTEKEIFFAGQKVLVDSVRDLPLKTPVEITYLENRKNKTTAGTTMIFQVSRLQ